MIARTNTKSTIEQDNKELASMLGRLENIAQIISVFGYFISNTRSLETLANEEAIMSD